MDTFKKIMENSEIRLGIDPRRLEAAETHRSRHSIEGGPPERIDHSRFTNVTSVRVLGFDTQCECRNKFEYVFLGVQDKDSDQNKDMDGWIVSI